MGKNVDYSVEDLIVKSEELLEGMGDITSLIGTATAETAESIIDEMHRTSLESLKEATDPQIDGYTVVRVSEDEMRAVADFHPPTGAMDPIETSAVAQLLSAKGISVGVDWDAIKEAVFRCNTERISITDVVIARGKRPVDEVPEHLVIEDLLMEPQGGSESDSGRVDFKEVNPFVLVKEGQVLAKPIPKKAGKMGATVLGKAIPYEALKIPQIEPGENTREEGGIIVADCDGSFAHNESSFWVNEILEVVGDVDYTIGHIDFPGDVIIKGEIKDGFKVHSRGSVFCAKTLDASEVISERDLIVKQGIIGKNRGKVKVGGEVKTNFIENCYLESEGSVYVENGIMNSAVNTLKKVELGMKGVVIGGTLYAQDGVTAVQIGSALGPRTEIYCGIDYSVEQKLEWIRNKNIELVFKLKQIKRKLKTVSPGRDKLLELGTKIKQVIQKLNETARLLVFKLDKNESAEVIVKGIIFPGAYIEICHFSYIVPRRMTKVRFRLDKKKGKVVVEPLMNDRST